MSTPKPPPAPKPVAAPPAPEKPPEVIEDAVTKKTDVKRRGTKSLRRGKSGLQISKKSVGTGLKIGGSSSSNYS